MIKANNPSTNNTNDKLITIEAEDDNTLLYKEFFLWEFIFAKIVKIQFVN